MVNDDAHRLSSWSMIRWFRTLIWMTYVKICSQNKENGSFWGTSDWIKLVMIFKELLSDDKLKSLL